MFSGRSVESAAYNPTMSPLHAALVAAVGSDGVSAEGGWSDIVAAVLVEVPGAPVQYADTVALILGVIAPRVGIALFLVFLGEMASNDRRCFGQLDQISVLVSSWGSLPDPISRIFFPRSPCASSSSHRM